MSFEVTDRLLCRLTEEWWAGQAARYPLKPARPHRFSRRFLERMEALCREVERREGAVPPAPQRGHHWNVRMGAAMLAAVVMGTTIAMASVRYFRMVREEYAKYSTIRYEEVEEGYKPEEFVVYHLGYLPEGFVQVEDTNLPTLHVETYQNGTGLGIRLRQMRIDDAKMDVDTEKVEPEKILLKGTQNAWFLDNKTLKTIYWDDGKYFFVVSGHLTKEELVKVAESLTDE